MQKKKLIIVITVAVILLILAGLILRIALLIFQTVGDIRPASLPPIKPTTGQIAAYLRPPDGYKIGYFAQKLGNPRDLAFSPKVVLVVSSTSEGKVIALVDQNHDGVADENKVILSNLNRPHGLAFYQDKLYLAEEAKISRYYFDEANLRAIKDKDILNLPSGGRHFTRTIVFRDNLMYVSIGSTCDVCVEKNPLHGSIIQVDPESGNFQIYASGLRNSVFMTLNDQTNQIWATEMGRDFLGDDLPPDEINIINQGDYGWPYCYGNKVVDTQFNLRGNCANSIAPVYNIPAHSAPLGLTFIHSTQMPPEWQGSLLVSYHGSWNRSVPTGYKIVKLKIEDGRVTSSDDFITGFLQGSQVVGRPVDVIFDSAGSLYISDDKSGVIYKLIKNE